MKSRKSRKKCVASEISENTNARLKMTERLRLRRHAERQRINAKQPHINYAEFMEQESQLIIFHPTVAMIFNVILVMIGGNCLLAANPIKRILFHIGAIEWETKLMRYFAFNVIISLGIAINLLMYVPSILLARWLGPCWSTTSGFLIYAFAVCQLGRQFHTFSILIWIAAVGISTSIIYNGLAFQFHLFRISSKEIFGLSFFTFAESFSVIFPILMQSVIDMKHSEKAEIHPSCRYTVSFILLFCGLFSSLYLSKSIPSGQMNEGDTSEQSDAMGSQDSLSHFFNSSAGVFSSRSGSDTADIQNIENDEESAWVDEDDICEEKKEIIPGDIQGSLLFSSNIENRDVHYKKQDYSNYDDPLFWRFHLIQKIFSLQFILICICLLWVQFVCLEYTLNSFDIILYHAKTAEVAILYQSLFELFIPFGQFSLNILLNVFYPNLLLNWRGIIYILAAMCLTCLLCSILSIIPIILVQLVTFFLLGFLWSLVKSFPIAAIIYIFGPAHFYVLFSISLAFRAFACFVWIFWQDFCYITLKSEIHRRFHYIQYVSGCICLLPVILLFWEPEVIDSFNSYGLDESHQNTSHHTHPSLYQHIADDLTRKENEPQNRIKKEALQPKIKAIVLGIGTLPDDIIIYERGKIIATDMEPTNTYYTFELMDVFGRNWHPQ